MCPGHHGPGFDCPECGPGEPLSPPTPILSATGLELLRTATELKEVNTDIRMIEDLVQKARCGKPITLWVATSPDMKPIQICLETAQAGAHKVASDFTEVLLTLSKFKRNDLVDRLNKLTGMTP